MKHFFFSALLLVASSTAVFAQSKDKRRIKHIGAQQFGMKFLLRGLYAHNGLCYFYTRIDNDKNMPFVWTL